MKESLQRYVALYDPSPPPPILYSIFLIALRGHHFHWALPVAELCSLACLLALWVHKELWRK